MTESQFVTVIMPIRNEAANITSSLQSILDQEFPLDRLEILIVDGLSTDGTKDIVQEIIDRTEQSESPYPKISLLDNEGKTAPTAMNVGLAQANGEMIIRVDGHCEIEPDYIQRCLDVLEETGADVVGGLQRAQSEGWSGQAIALSNSSPFGVGNSRFHYAKEAGWTDNVFLGAYRKEVFSRIGNFDEDLVRNQDDEFYFRLIQSGGKVWLDPSIQSTYHSRSDIKGLWRQYYFYGLYKILVIKKRSALPSWRHVVPAFFVLALVASFILAAITQQPQFTLIVAAPYLFASVIFSLWTARRNWKVLPLLPFTFLTMHLSYGIGFISGLWHWRRSPQPSR